MLDSLRDRIYDKVLKTITDISGHSPTELNGRTELILDLGLDSLAIFEIVIELEESFDLQITDEDIERIKTIDDIVDHIYRQENARKQD
ncbi:MAG TPA: acyl carrier protein [Clostridiales bacterium]|nr:acyl carrier protein [Clostridiales bacterium]